MPCPCKNAEPFHPARYALSCLQRAGARGRADPRWQGRLDALLPYPFAVTASPTDLHGGNVLRRGIQFTFLDWEQPGPGTRASNS